MSRIAKIFKSFIRIMDALVLIFLVLIFIWVMVWVYDLNQSSKPINFDSKKWQRDISGCSAGNIRKPMADDLMNILNKSKMNKSQVNLLLGRPELYKKDELWSYYAGADFIDCLSFDIHFDKQGLIEKSQLTQH